MRISGIVPSSVTLSQEIEAWSLNNAKGKMKPIGMD